MWQQVRSGSITDLGGLKNLEDMFEEGQRGRLDSNLRLPVSQSVAGELQNRLKQTGVEDARVIAAGQQMKIEFRKGFPALAVIAATILALVVLAVLILGWQIFREVVPESLQPLIGTFGLLVALAVLAALAWNSSKIR